MADLELKIRLQPKQADLWDLWDDHKHTRIGFGGARGGAKSGGLRRISLLRRLKYENTTGLILRRTLPELEKSHILEMFREYPHLRDYYYEQKKMLAFPNGSVQFFGSAPHAGDMNDYYSAQFADVVIDESQEFTQGEQESLGITCRDTSNPAITPKQICGFMPGRSETGLPPKGLAYLKRVFVDRELKGEEKNRNWAFVQAFSWDNIEWARKELGWYKDETGEWQLSSDGVSEEEFYSWPEAERREFFINETEFGQNLASMTNKYLRDAWLYGKWEVFEGQYYPQFSRERYVISREERDNRIQPWHTRTLCGDWGYDHPHAFYKLVQDEHKHVIIHGEIWGRETGEIDLGRMITAQCLGETYRSFPLSWDAGKLSPRSQPNLPQSMMQLLATALGPKMPRPHPADSSPGSRVSGARLISQLLETDMLTICEDCPKLIECLPSLVRDAERNTEDVLKVDFSENGIGDDPYDAIRMGLQHMFGKSVIPATEIAARTVQKYAESRGKDAEDLDINATASIHRRALAAEVRKRKMRRGGLGKVRRPQGGGIR